jgi:hypothetical protein
MKNWMFVAFLSVMGTTFGQGSYGDVVGNVYEPDGKQAAYGARCIIDDQGKKYQANCDADGRFRITSIPAGEYKMNIIYKADTMQGIYVNVPLEGYFNAGDIKFEGKSGVKTFKEFTVKSGDRIKIGYGEMPAPELSAKEIKQSPNKFDIKKLASTMTTDVKMTNDGELVFRGARKGDMVYMIDGIKANEVFNVPSVAIGRMKVYAGALPAKYGDTLGGVVVVETKSYFDLYREWNMNNGEE